MYTIALTGGIASGKTAVANRFAAHDIEIVDADIVARELVAPGMLALDEIVVQFGSDVLAADGSLDRRALRERVFAEAGARQCLEAILHPRIRAELRARAEAARSAYAMIVVPLLVESGQYAWVDRVLVIDAPREVQIERLVARDGIDLALAESMLAAQATREQRLAIADDVIDNSNAIESLDAKIDSLHHRYLALAAADRSS
jgi:dephospho-CoA kinase